MRASQLDFWNDGQVNVGSAERIASTLLGAALISAGLARRRMSGLALALGGLAFVKRGVSGHCGVYERMGVTTRDRSDGARPRDYFERGIHVEESVTVQRPLGEVFAFWRALENLPRFMDHVREVRVLDDKRSHWVIEGPAGDVEWDAEIINEEPNRLISWKTVAGSEVDNAGTVIFREAAAGRGTEIRVVLDYLPPAGKLGATIARLLGDNPGHQIREDLRCMRELLETGEVPTTDGQPSGRAAGKAGLKGRAMTAMVAAVARTTNKNEQPTRSFGRRVAADRRAQPPSGRTGEKFQVERFEGEGGPPAPKAQDARRTQ
jgi:uncharacterized membrane protein